MFVQGDSHELPVDSAVVNSSRKYCWVWQTGRPLTWAGRGESQRSRSCFTQTETQTFSSSSKWIYRFQFLSQQTHSWVLTSYDTAALLLSLQTLSCSLLTLLRQSGLEHSDLSYLNTCMLKPIWEKGTLWLAKCWRRLTCWKVWGVWALSRGEMTKATMMSGCCYCWHSTDIFHHQCFTALSPAESSRATALTDRLASVTIETKKDGANLSFVFSYWCT